MTARAVVVDIEGTTSSIAFVTDTLFPYAREHLVAYCTAHTEVVAPLLAEVREAEPGDPLATVTRWIDEDRKATPLKVLQGMIWADGFADGTLAGHVYPDAAAALRQWHAEGVRLYVYSSGSVAAQKLIFGRNNIGDLSPLFSGWFDTTTGAKREPASYAAIAQGVDLAPTDILFLSDTPEEVAAARAAGLRAVYIDREHGRGEVASFAEVTP